jgi:IS605 OrfB family transposase
MLKKKKGCNIVTKSLRCKLQRKGFNLLETKTAYNEVVFFFFLLIDEHPEGVDLPVKDNGGWRYYELLVLGDNPLRNFPFIGFPSALRRSAIRRAIGAYCSWRTSFVKWQNRPKKQKKHRPPMKPRTFNFSPSFDVGMRKEDDGSSIVLKLLVKGQWKWVKFYYQAPPCSSEWVKGSPSVVCKGNETYICFPLEKYVPATGGAKTVMTADSYRVCGVDTDLDRHIAIASILEIDAKGNVREVARRFINQTRHIKRRKRDLGLIAQAMSKTGIVNKGFASNRWQKLTNREVEASRTFSRQLVEFAKHYDCSVIAFEHLGNLRPCKGKYSRRSNQKRAYWLKSKLFKQVNYIAYRDYGILTTRVSPRNTSRLDPWGNPVGRGNEFPTNLIDYLSYENGANFVATTEGYKAHSGVNAARNIGLKAIGRHRTNPYFVRGKPKLEIT